MAIARKGVDTIDASASILARVSFAFVDVDLAFGSGVSGDARAKEVVLFVDARGTVHARPRQTLVDVILLENMSK